jgi:hypothetical protein
MSLASGTVAITDGDAGVAQTLALVHFAAADPLMVGRLQVEAELAVGRALLLVARCIDGMLAYRFDAAARARLVLVPLALEDDFAVAGLEVEVGFAAPAGKQGELAAHELRSSRRGRGSTESVPDHGIFWQGRRPGRSSGFALCRRLRFYLRGAA